MTTTRRRPTITRSVALVVSLCPLTASAADLPFGSGGSSLSVPRYAESRTYTAMQWPIYSQAHRFDIYGNPLGGYFIEVPDPLVVNNGCAKAVEPTYDIDGNLAGYAPLVACR